MPHDLADRASARPWGTEGQPCDPPSTQPKVRLGYIALYYLHARGPCGITLHTPPFRWGSLATCIFGSLSLGWYVLTRLLSDGYFQAYRPVVIARPRLCSLRAHLVTLPVGLGCFPLDRRYLAIAVGLHVLCVPIRSLSGRRYPLTSPSTNRALPDTALPWALLKQVS